MSDISTLFFDIGGVLATNGWDRNSRRHCVESFGLDYEEFRDRHEFVADAFETGRLTIDEYLARTIFYRERDFTPQAFQEAMVSESETYPEAMQVLPLVSMGLILENLALLLWGPDYRSPQTALGLETLWLGPVMIDVSRLIAFALAISVG